MNQIVQAYTPFSEDGSPGAPVVLDGEKALEIVEKIATEADCDPADPPNQCTW